MAEYCLTAEEVLYLAAVAGADMFYGVPDTLSGLSDQELKLKVVEMEESLGQKGYLQEDFDGNRTVLPELEKMIEHCGNCERFVCFEKAQVGEPQYSCIYFMSGNETYKMEYGREQYTLSKVELSVVRKEIEQGVIVKETVQKVENVFGIPREELEKAAILARRGSAEKGVELLRTAGATDLTAQAVVNGILNKSDYYALLFMDLGNETAPDYSVQFLSGEVLIVMEYDTDEDADLIKCSAISEMELNERLKAGFEKIGCFGEEERFI